MKKIFLIILLINLLLSINNIANSQNQPTKYQYKFVFQDYDGKILKNIPIDCYPIDNIGSLTETVTSDGELIAQLKPGRYKIRFFSVDGRYDADDQIYNVTDKNEFNATIVLFKKLELKKLYAFKGYVEDNNKQAIENASIVIDLPDTVLKCITDSIGRYFVRFISSESLAGKNVKYSLRHSLFLPVNAIPYTIKADEKIIENLFTLKKKSEKAEFLLDYSSKSKIILNDNFAFYIGFIPVVYQKGEIVASGLIENRSFSDFFSIRTLWFPSHKHYFSLDAAYFFQNIPIVTENSYETLPGIKGVAEFNYTLKNFMSIGIRSSPFEFFNIRRYIDPYLSISGLYFIQKPDVSEIVVDNELLINSESVPHFTFKLEGGIQLRIFKNWAVEAYLSYFKVNIDTYEYQFNYFGTAESVKTKNKYSNFTFGLNFGFFIF